MNIILQVTNLMRIYDMLIRDGPGDRKLAREERQHRLLNEQSSPTGASEDRSHPEPTSTVDVRKNGNYLLWRL